MTEAQRTAEGAAAAKHQAPPQLPANSLNAPFSYANYCRVTSTPEEVFLDIGVNTQPFAESTESVHITQRVAFNYYTAKRMLRALQMAVGRHEDTFGRVQMDVRKRVTPKESGEQSDAEQNGQVPPDHPSDQET